MLERIPEANNSGPALSGFSGLVSPGLLGPSEAPLTLPAPSLGLFVRDALLTQTSPLYNVSHDHLNSAMVGFLLTNVEATRRGKQIMGQAEMPSQLSGSPWAKARARQQLAEWFPEQEPDFLITLYAPYIGHSPAVNQMALLEHELYHCGQKLNEYECPMFKKDGSPVFTLIGHDVEEFVGVSRRYGVGAGRTRELAEAFLAGPEFGQITVESICGTCLR